MDAQGNLLLPRDCIRIIISLCGEEEILAFRQTCKLILSFINENIPLKFITICKKGGHIYEQNSRIEFLGPDIYLARPDSIIMRLTLPAILLPNFARCINLMEFRAWGMPKMIFATKDFWFALEKGKLFLILDAKRRKMTPYYDNKEFYIWEFFYHRKQRFLYLVTESSLLKMDIDKNIEVVLSIKDKSQWIWCFDEMKNLLYYIENDMENPESIHWTKEKMNLYSIDVNTHKITETAIPKITTILDDGDKAYLCIRIMTIHSGTQWAYIVYLCSSDIWRVDLLDGSVTLFAHSENVLGHKENEGEHYYILTMAVDVDRHALFVMLNNGTIRCVSLSSLEFSCSIKLEE